MCSKQKSKIKTPGTDLNETKLSDLSDKEFKIILDFFKQKKEFPDSKTGQWDPSDQERKKEKQ